MQFFNSSKPTIKGFSGISFSSDDLIISNHVSIDDVSLIQGLLPSNVTLAIYENEKESIAKIDSNRKILLYNPLNAQSLVELKNELEGENPVFIFPEVMVSPSKIVSRVFTEVADLIRRTNPTIHPISIAGGGITNPTTFSDLRIELLDSFKIDTTHLTEKKEINHFIINTLIKKMQDNYFYQSIGEKKNINLYNELLSISKRTPDKMVIVEDPTSKFTYKDLILSANVFYQKLKPTLANEKNIGVLLPSAGANVLTIFSLFKLGKVPAMLNFSMGASTLLDCVKVANIKVVLSSKNFIEQGELHHLIEALKDEVLIIYLEDLKENIQANQKLMGLTQYMLNSKADVGHNELILFTSGSENKPKGVILTHDNILSNIYQCLSFISIDINTDKMFNALPMFHSFGLTVGSILPVIVGMPTFLYPSPLHHRLIPELVYQKQSTLMFGTSTFFSMYGNDAHPNALQSIRLAVVGGEKLKDDVYETWFTKFGVKIVEGYGVTEGSPVLSINTPLANKKHSIGKLLPGIDYKLEPVEGINGYNLLVKGPNIMKGYLIHGEGYVPCKDWYTTGDVVDIDSDGFLKIISRLKRFSKIGGEMVSLNLVEDIAFKTYGENKFAAVSIPDKRKGERIILFTSMPELNLKDFKRYIKSIKESALLLPKEMVYIEQIPLLGSGKTDYVTLQKQALELFEK